MYARTRQRAAALAFQESQERRFRSNVAFLLFCGGAVGGVASDDSDDGDCDEDCHEMGVDTSAAHVHQMDHGDQLDAAFRAES